MISKEELYSNRIFLNAVLPLFKVIIDADENLKKGFAGKNAVIQVSAKTEGKKVGTHFVIEAGEVTVKTGTAEKPDVELQFKSIKSLNDFFKGKSKMLPHIRGFRHLGLLLAFFKVLLKMAAVLGTTEPPADEKDKKLLVKLYFYLLSAGISQLNKAGHPDVSKWAQKSPDRVYAWRIADEPDISAYIRVKAGNTKSARGMYTRSKPFFTMCFDSVDSALGILLQKDDMIESSVKKKLIMEGAPEYGAQLGEFMLLVGSYAK